MSAGVPKTVSRWHHGDDVYPAADACEGVQPRKAAHLFDSVGCQQGLLLWVLKRRKVVCHLLEVQRQLRRLAAEAERHDLLRSGIAGEISAPASCDDLISGRRAVRCPLGLGHLLHIVRQGGCMLLIRIFISAHQVRPKSMPTERGFPHAVDKRKQCRRRVQRLQVWRISLSDQDWRQRQRATKRRKLEALAALGQRRGMPLALPRSAYIDLRIDGCILCVCTDQIGSQHSLLPRPAAERRFRLLIRRDGRSAGVQHQPQSRCQNCCW